MKKMSLYQHLNFSMVWAHAEHVAEVTRYLPKCEEWSFEQALGRPHPPFTSELVTHAYVTDVSWLGKCALELETELVAVLALRDRYVVYRAANDGRLHPLEVSTYEDAVGVANDWFNCYEPSGSNPEEDPMVWLANVGTDAILRREQEGTFEQQLERRHLIETTRTWIEEEPEALRLLRPDAYRFNDEHLVVETRNIQNTGHLRDLLTPIFGDIEFTVHEFTADATLAHSSPTLVTMSHSSAKEPEVPRLRSAEGGQLMFNPLLRPADWLCQKQAEGMWISYVNVERPLGEQPFFESVLGVPRWVVEQWAKTQARPTTETVSEGRWWAVSFPGVGTSVIVPTEGAVLEASSRDQGRFVSLEAKETVMFRRDWVEDYEIAAANLDLLDPNREPVDVEGRYEDALAEVKAATTPAREATLEGPATPEHPAAPIHPATPETQDRKDK